jgi:hypothetical protein
MAVSVLKDSCKQGTTAMITSEDQLTPGRELWYIHGHLDRQAVKIQVLSGVQTLNVSGHDYRIIEVIYGKDGAFQHQGRCHLADVGIGANYNRNRLFETQQAALAYWDSAECQEYRSWWSWEAAADYSDPYYNMIDNVPYLD